MFNQFEPNVKALITFLTLLKVKVNNATVNETLQNHPDWPSLMCIGDALNAWHIPNAAGKMEPNEIDQLPVPFLAYTHNREFPISIVTNVTSETVEHYTKNYNESMSVNRNNFITSWSGIYLIAEPDSEAGEKNYQLTRRKIFINALVPACLFILLLAASFFLFQQTISLAHNATAPSLSGVYLQYIIMLAGTIITSLLLWYEIDKNNPLLQKVCTGLAKGNCNAIPTGKQAKLFSWLSWSEVGFFYFTGGF